MRHAQQLMERIIEQNVTVAVFGLGYVGLPLALAFAERGFPVVGVDVDASKVSRLCEGYSYLRHIASARVQAAIDEGRLVAASDAGLLSRADVIIICVPTPLTASRAPDLSYVESCAREICASLRPGQLVVLESTTYPGTTDQVVKPILEASGLEFGRDFFLAFSPEREDPGNLVYSTTSIPKVVGGCDALSGDLAEALYAQVMDKVVRVSSAAAGEACKLTENVFRAVNIALANELKVVFEGLGLDIWEIIDAAATKPFGFMRFAPGPGWGGHCIPLDPFYLSWRARVCGLDTKFIELAGEINRSMPNYVVARLQEALNARGQCLKGSGVLVLGVAYKKDVSDTRESPAFPIMQRLASLGARLGYHDPHVATLPREHASDGVTSLRSISLTPDTLARFDALVLVTDHAAVDYGEVHRHARLIVDTRGVYRDGAAHVVRA